MKAVIVGASFEALHTIEKAHEYGLTVTALDGNPDAPGLAAADKGLVVDISKEQAVIEAVKKEQADFVLTAPIGRYLTTIGAVNDALCLPGISREMAVLCTDKYRFHEKLSGQGLRSCHCYAVGKEKTDDRKLFNDILSGKLPIKFPAVLKPRFGSGSRGICVIRGKEDLAAVLQEPLKEPCLLEECIEGEEYGVDGAVAGGKFHLILLRKKVNTPMPARQAVAYFSVLPSEPFYSQAAEYMKEIIACMGLNDCLLHADLIKSRKGPFVIEVSARPSGHNLHNLFTPLCTGIDEAEEYIRYRMGKSFCFTPDATKLMMIHYFDMEGRVKQVPNREAVSQMLKDNRQLAENKALTLAKWNCTIREGDDLSPVKDGHSVMGRGYFILEGGGWEALLAAAEKIKTLFF